MDGDISPKGLFYSTHRIQDFVQDIHSHQLSPCLTVMGTIPQRNNQRVLVLAGSLAFADLGLPLCHGVEHPWMCFPHLRAYFFHYFLLSNLNSCHKLPIASLVMSA